MSKVQPTPGPYRILEVIPSSEHARWGRAPEGHDTVHSQTDYKRSIGIRSTTNHMENLMGSWEGGHLAEVPMLNGEEGRQQAIANAHLFAAANDLRAACEVAMEWFDRFGVDAAEVYHQLRDAVAKAHGATDVVQEVGQ